MDKSEIRKLLQDVDDSGIERVIISNKCKKDYDYRKVEIRRVLLKGAEGYQASSYTDKQVFQQNISTDMVVDKMLEYFPDNLCQINIFTETREYGFKVTGKGKLLKNVKAISVQTKEGGLPKKNPPSWDLSYNQHNRQKNYILKEGTVIPPLVDMGVFTREGKVIASMYDKFKQINRFIEMIDDVLKDETKEELHIIDFGCGKSYLTFIIYYYLVGIKGKKADIVGLDLKKDVIEKCNRTAEKYGYNGLKFEMGDINGYKTDKPVDMVVTLHACDTATDYALYNAVQWNARYIMSVPCCQHELNTQIKSSSLAPMMQYGIIKERMAALATDAIRGKMLEACGYKTQLLEFVDLAHSPKNILIRAVRTNIGRDRRKKAFDEVERMCEELSVEPTICKLLAKVIE